MYKRIKVVFNNFDEEEFEDVMVAVWSISDILYDRGFSISDRDCYQAWLAGNMGVWEDPQGYTDDMIVQEVLRFTELSDENEDEGPGGDEEWEDAEPYRTISDEEWDSISDQLEDYDYEPTEQNASVEGTPWLTASDTDRLEAFGNQTVH